MKDADVEDTTMKKNMNAVEDMDIMDITMIVDANTN